MANTWVYVVVASLVIGVHQVFGDGPCSGYEMILEKLKVCEGTESSVISIDGLNGTLREDCIITGLGSGSFKPFGTAVLKYEFHTTPVPSTFERMLRLMPMKGEVDMCDFVQRAPPGIVGIMNILGIPSSCPVAEKTISATDSTSLNLVDVPSYRIFLDLIAALGRTTGTISIVHDTGVTCLEFAWNLRKTQ